MYVTLEARTPCHLCGFRFRVIRFSDVRVNKASLRERGVSLVSAGEWLCPECHEPNAWDMIPVSGYRLHPEDAVRVEAYRTRRWPEKGAPRGGVARDIRSPAPHLYL